MGKKKKRETITLAQQHVDANASVADPAAKPTCSFTRRVARWYQSYCQTAGALAQRVGRESGTSGVFVVVDMVAGKGEKPAWSSGRVRNASETGAQMQVARVSRIRARVRCTATAQQKQHWPPSPWPWSRAWWKGWTRGRSCQGVTEVFAWVLRWGIGTWWNSSTRTRRRTREKRRTSYEATTTSRP